MVVARSYCGRIGSRIVVVTMALRRLDVADRVTHKLSTTSHKCLHGQATDYLSQLHTPVARVAEPIHQRTTHQLLVAPTFQLSDVRKGGHGGLPPPMTA